MLSACNLFYEVEVRGCQIAGAEKKKGCGIEHEAPKIRPRMAFACRWSG